MSNLGSRADERALGQASLFQAMCEAQARGLSSTEASGMFKAALQQLGEIERDTQRNRNKEEDSDTDVPPVFDSTVNSSLTDAGCRSR